MEETLRMLEMWLPSLRDREQGLGLEWSRLVSMYNVDQSVTFHPSSLQPPLETSLLGLLGIFFWGISS